MKIATTLSLTFAVAGALAFANPAQAQRHSNGGGNASMSHGNGTSPTMAGGNTQRGAPQAGNFNRSGNNFERGNFHHGNFGHYRYHRGGGVNFYFGGFGYPYYGYPYYGYGYGYPYGYGYYAQPGVAYQYDPQGVYNGRVVRSRDAKDQASLEAQVQHRLAQAGYYHGTIDGVVGERTRSAIRSYERANGLRVDGRIDDELLQTMGLG